MEVEAKGRECVKQSKYSPKSAHVQHSSDPEVSYWFLNLELELIHLYSDPSCGSSFVGRNTGWIYFCWVIWLTLKVGLSVYVGLPRGQRSLRRSRFSRLCFSYLAALCVQIWMQNICVRLGGTAQKRGLRAAGGGEEKDSRTSFTTQSEDLVEIAGMENATEKKKQLYFQNVVESMHPCSCIQTKTKRTELSCWLRKWQHSKQLLHLFVTKNYYKESK